MPPDEQQFGLAQEERVRAHLVSLGYTQPFGETDEEIRRSLSIKGKCADFVGYHPQLDQWLIAESKGSDIQAAEKQLANTLSSLLARQPQSAGKIDLQIYVKAEQYDRLPTVGLGGYYLLAIGDYLGTYDESDVWNYSAVAGIKLLAVREGER